MSKRDCSDPYHSPTPVGRELMPREMHGRRKSFAPWAVLFGLHDILRTMGQRDKPPWGRCRRYSHFDAPLTLMEARALVTDPGAVARHGFWPLIGFVRSERRWKKSTQSWRTKRRPIAYAAHADSHIFAYYSWGISKLYDQELRARGIDQCVLAYRSGAGLVNYTCAAEVFAQIAARPECEVVGIDVEQFFDNIPHRPLKDRWKALLGVAELPPDHYRVFRAATRSSVVPIAQVRAAVGVGRRRFRPFTRVPLSPAQFRERVLRGGLINVNTKCCGIPQGLPISGTLANLVLIDLDTRMHAACEALGGVYRRYSDDILLICPAGASAVLERLLKDELAALELRYQDDKTVRRSFKRGTDGVLRSTVSGGEDAGKERPLPYLGFDFDGQRVLLRPQTLTRFSKRMRRAVRMAKRSAAKRTPPGEVPRVRRRKLYMRFSHLNPHPETPSRERPKGSFYKYAKRAQLAFATGTYEDAFRVQITRQLRRQWLRLLRLIAEADEDLAKAAESGATVPGAEGAHGHR